MGKVSHASLPLMFAAALLGQGCSSTELAEQQRLVGFVDLPSFMGDWYVIGNIPTMFEKGAVNAIEGYAWNDEKKRIDINFRYRQDSPTGEEKKIPQTGWVHNEKTNSEWRVQPWWPLSFGYYILELAPDYSYSVIGVPSKKWAWILARKPVMDEATYQQLSGKLKDRGYDVSKLQKVPQIW